MTGDEIRAAVDAAMEPKWAELDAKQAQFFAGLGRYWQGLWTHSAPPADGAFVAPDQLGDKPGYELYTWAQQGGVPATMQCRICVDTYDGPEGKGYVAILEMMDQGVVWQRRRNFGPETWHDSGGWQPMPWLSVLGVQ